MGSKRAMLGNGLGDSLARSLLAANTVFDLFTGSASVAWHVAEHYEKKVFACDLQLYSAVLAAAVIERTEPLTDLSWVDDWFDDAKRRLDLSADMPAIVANQRTLGIVSVSASATRARDLSHVKGSPLTMAYGGYYFSAWQAVWLDALRASLPLDITIGFVALAALIQAASRCAAAPGHTAQPFKPNETAGPFLIDAWRRDLPTMVRVCVADIAPRHARVRGEAYCMDALELAETAERGDLAFIDPPYSGVHYSRFYHVLESVAQGETGQVAGSGRYPKRENRPSSDYSLRKRSRTALDALLQTLSVRGASALVTFPAGGASNGLSGEDVKNVAGEHFKIAEEKVTSRFSTLGGDKKHRAARKDAQELILTLSPPAMAVPPSTG